MQFRYGRRSGRLVSWWRGNTFDTTTHTINLINEHTVTCGFDGADVTEGIVAVVYFEVYFEVEVEARSLVVCSVRFSFVNRRQFDAQHVV